LPVQRRETEGSINIQKRPIDPPHRASVQGSWDRYVLCFTHLGSGERKEQNGSKIYGPPPMSWVSFMGDAKT